MQSLRERSAITTEVQVGCDSENGNGDKRQKPSYDLCIKEGFAVAFVGPNRREHQAEIGGTHQHGNAKDGFDDPTVIKTYTEVFGAEAAGAAGRHSQGSGIKPRHFREP